MPTLTEIKQNGWLQPHQIKQVEDMVAERIRQGDMLGDLGPTKADNMSIGFLMVLNFDDWHLVHPEALTERSVNVVVEKADVERIKTAMLS
jgi:hypothetical protein